jgi:hypothetical protein
MFSNIIVDLADITRLSGTVVLGGQAFHFVVPTFPDFMKEQYEDLFDLEQTRCGKTEEQYQFHMNGITKDEGRNTRSILFVLPDGFAFTDDFLTPDASPSIMDRNVRVMMRQLVLSKSLEIGGPPIPQKFYPGFFELRVLSCEAASKELKSKSKSADPFLSYFSGMRVSGGKDT